jgi:pilus assembly protein CpaF
VTDVRTPLDTGLVQTIQVRVARRLSVESQTREAHGEPPLFGDDEQQYALSLIAAEVEEHVRTTILAGGDIGGDRHFEERLSNAVFSRMYAAGALQELLDNPDVENIDINGCDDIWVSSAADAEPRPHPPLWASDEEMVAAIQVLGAHAGVNPRPWTRATPVLGLRLADGSRLSGVMGAGNRPTISIRRSRFQQMFLPGLYELGTVNRQVGTFLEAFMKTRMNGMIGGSVNTGKTTMMRALLNVLPVTERLIVVELSQELCLYRHPDLHANVVEWEEVLPDAEDKGGLSMSELVRQSLRFNGSRVIVGEVLGEEITALLNAMGQGDGGSLGTIHCHSSLAALDRIATYAAQGSSKQDFAVTHALVAGAIDFIVYLHRDRITNRRTVAEIREVTGFDGKRATSHLIFAAPYPGGTALRVDTDISPERLARLRAAGYDDAAPWGEE